MKKKKFVLLFCLLCLTGCTVDYNLTIDTNKKVTENSTFSLSNNIIEKNDLKPKDFLEEKKNSYSSFLESKGYSSKFAVNKEFVTGNIQKEYDSITDYINSDIYKMMFTSAKINDTGNVYTFESDGYYYDGIFTSMVEGEENIMGIEKINIKVKFYNKVIKTNADQVDEKNNIYTWTVTKNDQTKKIYFQLSSKKRYDIILLAFLSQYKLYLWIGIACIIGIILGYFIIKAQIRRRNRI